MSINTAENKLITAFLSDEILYIGVGAQFIMKLLYFESTSYEEMHIQFFSEAT